MAPSFLFFASKNTAASGVWALLGFLLYGNISFCTTPDLLHPNYPLLLLTYMPFLTFFS